MTPDNVGKLFDRLDFGYQLTTDEQRWLWNCCVRFSQGDDPEEAVAFRSCGELPDLKRCNECNGTGNWGEDYEWGLMSPLMCLKCAGTGRIHEEEIVDG